jgi:hypothetical protein
MVRRSVLAFGAPNVTSRQQAQDSDEEINIKRHYVLNVLSMLHTAQRPISTFLLENEFAKQYYHIHCSSPASSTNIMSDAAKPKGVGGVWDFLHSRRNPPKDPKGSFVGKTVLVTGANSGLISQIFSRSSLPFEMENLFHCLRVMKQQ